MSAGPLLPAWGVLPVAAALMVVVAAHIEATRSATQPESRRRIRLVNGWVMLVMIPLTASGFSLLDPDLQRRAFVLVWATVVWLIGVSLLLALLDVWNTLRLARRDKADLERSFEDLKRDIARLRAERKVLQEARPADDGPAA